LQGLPFAPKNIGIQTDEKGPYEIERIFMENIIKPVSYSSNGLEYETEAYRKIGRIEKAEILSKHLETLKLTLGIVSSITINKQAADFSLGGLFMKVADGNLLLLILCCAIIQKFLRMDFYGKIDIKRRM
jgi:hypothetical protein